MLELTTELYETDSVAIFIFPLRSRLKDFHFFFPLYRSSFHVSHHMSHQKGATFISNCQMLFTTPTCVPHWQFSCHVKHSQLATGEGVMRDEGKTKNTEMWEKMERKGEWEKDGDELDFKSIFPPFFCFSHSNFPDSNFQSREIRRKQILWFGSFWRNRAVRENGTMGVVS